MNAKHALEVSLVCLLLLVAVPVRAEEVVVRIENPSGNDGIFFTPVWVGFHDGGFDLFDAGTVAPAGGVLERLAEDGDVEALQADFAARVPDGVGGFVVAPEGFPDVPVFDPGDTGSAAFELDPSQNRYMSFAAMVVPSNDAFIGTDDPMGIELFDAAGNFTGPRTIRILGTDVWDAGTELNNEMDAAFINQGAPNTGVATVEPIGAHPGFIGSFANPSPGRDPIILGAQLDTEFFIDPVAADFTRPGYVVAEITIVPEPATVVLLMAGSVSLLRRRRRTR